MDLNFKTQLADQYISTSQKARILTEDWVLREIFCPNCGNPINNYSGTKVFFCA